MHYVHLKYDGVRIRELNNVIYMIFVSFVTLKCLYWRVSNNKSRKKNGPNSSTVYHKNLSTNIVALENWPWETLFLNIFIEIVVQAWIFVRSIFPSILKQGTQISMSISNIIASIILRMSVTLKNKIVKLKKKKIKHLSSCRHNGASINIAEINNQPIRTVIQSLSRQVELSASIRHSVILPLMRLFPNWSRIITIGSFQGS